MTTKSTRLPWWARKAIRGAAGRAAWISGWVAATERWGAGPRVRAVTYHRFGDVPRDPWMVKTGDFEAQIRWLAEQRRAISLDDLSSFLAGRRSLADGSVLVTIDDGCRSTLSAAAPVLREYGVPAAAFVSAGLVGTTTAAADHEEGFLSWDELASLHESGIEIGSHGFDHRSLGCLEIAEARDQALRSRELLEERLGARVRAFAYPFGMPNDFSAETDRSLAEAGYEIAFNSLHGAIVPGVQPISLPRVKIEAGEGLAMFQLSCRGAMDPWRLVDDALGRLRTQRDETTAATSERSPGRSS